MNKMNLKKKNVKINVYVGDGPSESEPQDLYACRVCLATDIKLFDIYDCNLAQSFESVMGTPVPPDSGLPQHLCHYCCVLLQKCAAFRDRFTRSNFILQTAVLLNEKITTEFIRTIDREAESLSLPLTACSKGFIDYEIIEDAADVDELKVVFQKQEEDVKEPKLKSSRKQSFQRKPAKEVVVPIPEEFLEDDTICEDIIEEEIPEIYHPNIQLVTLTPVQQRKEVTDRLASPAYHDSPYKCEKCYHGFYARHAYTRHMYLHNATQGAHKCEICLYRLPSAEKLRNHIATEHEKRYVCLICDYRTNDGTRALNHQNIHNGTVHDGVLIRKESQDEQFQHSDPQLVCEDCGDTFDSRYAVKQHRLEIHNCLTPSETWLSCGTCSIELKTVDAFNRHLATAAKHADTKLDYSCSHCGESFRRESLLNSHRSTHAHKDGRFHCPECGEALPTDAQLSRHFKSAHEHLIQYCDTVEDSDQDCKVVKPNLLKKIKKNKKKRIVLKNLLQVPEKPNNEKKRHICKFCRISFKSRELLVPHKKTHVGEQPYICKICFKTFRRCTNLTRHLKVHTGLKPYTCDVCGKSFTQWASRSVHQKIVHFKMPDL